MSPRVFRSLHKSRRQQEKPNKSNRKSLFEVLEDRRLLATVGFTAGADVVGMRQPPQTLETNRHELVIVDKATPDYRQLVAGLTGTGAGNPDVVYLDSRTDGVVAIGQILSQHSDLDAIHIVSHGQPGAMELGSVLLNAQNLPNYADSIRGWSAALKGGGDILLYGCDVAANAQGQKLVEEIHELTGADVAASTDETGSAALGGNWVLEFTAGPIETPVAFSYGVQASWDHVLAQQTFASDSYIVDMGQSDQTVGNALKPYGLIYDLVTNYKVPVKWAINRTKTTFRLDAGNPIPVDFTATITTGTKNYSGGSFIIDAAFLTPAVTADINTWKAQGVVVDTLAAPLTTEIFGQVTSFPRAVLDSANGNLAVPYYTNAGIPASSYVIGNPTNLTTCNDVYILPHADPNSWPVLWQQDLYNFIVNDGGGLWAGCHSVSEIEDLVIGGTTQLNFLTNGGLVPFGSHSAGTPPYSYNPAAANDPEMQILNRLDAATQNGSEQIYVPISADWRSTTTVAVFDPDHPNNPAGGTTPFNDAAAVAYGNAFGNPANGLVMYEAGQSLSESTAAANIAAQRAFFNYLLTEGILKAPQPAVSIPTIVAGQPATLTATISGGSGSYSYQWVSTNGGVFSVPSGSSKAGETITTQYQMTGAKDTVRLLVTDSCGRQGIYATNLETPLLGDFNHNGVVDGADYVLWRKTLNQSVPPFSGADGDGDGTIDQDDYGVWRAHFGMTLPGPSAGSGTAATTYTAAGDVSESVASLLTESKSVPAKAGATAARAASFEVLETRLLSHSSSARSRGRIHQYTVAEPAGDDLSLLLAIDRVWRTPRQESSVAVGENCEHHSDQDDSGREIDQPLAVALAERRGARSI